MLDERLLKILVCPACRASLEYKERRKVLICTECAARFEVRDGIPIMLTVQDAVELAAEDDGGA